MEIEREAQPAPLEPTVGRVPTEADYWQDKADRKQAALMSIRSIAADLYADQARTRALAKCATRSCASRIKPNDAQRRVRRPIKRAIVSYLGVIVFAGDLVVYEFADFELPNAYALLAAAFSAHRLGEEKRLPFSAELHNAIEADFKHQVDKRVA